MVTPQVPADLRGVAEAAAREYFAGGFSLERLGHGQSLAYRATVAGGDYLLRVHSPRCPAGDVECLTPQAIESECAWLRALCDETDLVVQEPMAAPSGGYVVHVPGGAGAVPCSLLGWVEGEHLEGKLSAEQASRLGELLAELHGHTKDWKRPSGFERPTFDTVSWRAKLAPVDDLVTSGLVSSAEHALLARAVDRFDRELTPLEAQPERIGLIHADLHRANYVFHRGSPRPIDFGRAGFGPWLYDIAEAVGGLGPQRRRDLIGAYSRRWPLQEGDLRRIEGYLIASLIEVFGNNAPDPGEHEYLARAVPAWAPHFRRYLEGTPFLYDL